MNKEPNPNTAKSAYRFEILDDPEFIAEVKRLEQLLNDSDLEEKELALFAKDIIDDLNDLFGEKYIDHFVDVIAEAYTADDEGDLTGDEDILSADKIMYTGIDIIQPLTQYEIVFSFTDIVIDESTEDASSPVSIYFVPIDKFVKFVPSEEAPIDNERLHEIFSIHASRSEAIVQDSEFKDAGIVEQLDVLESIATNTAHDVMAICGDDIVAVDADKYYITSPSENGPVLTTVDQSNVPKAKRKMPIGIPDGCTFREFLTSSFGSNIKALEHDYPSLIITDDENNLTYLFPIRDLRAMYLVSDTAE